MYKRVLFALDLEGVNNVVGEPYSGLAKGCDQWLVARTQAVLEINAAADALFTNGVEKIGLWDNHGGGENVDPAALDTRITLIQPNHLLPRMAFAKGEYDCICFFGYHAMEGTLGGVLAHTMNSSMVQYYKLNGHHIGELNMDAYIAASYGIPACFYVGGDIACAQAQRAVPGITTVITKYEHSRNEADFRDNEVLFKEIRDKIVVAVCSDIPAYPLTFPTMLEKSFKRTEDAARYYACLMDRGYAVAYPDDEILGKDAHTVVSVIHKIEDLINCL